MRIPCVLKIAMLIIAALIFKVDFLSADHSSIPSVPYPYFQYATPELWGYLRLGLNYLESPKPLLAPEAVLPSYMHPDAKGFGAYGLSPEAYADVQRLYPFFKEYCWQDIMHSHKLYDLANQAFADWLLKNLTDYIPAGATKKEIFDILQKAWNLGLSGFKSGRLVVASRTLRSEEFKTNLEN